MSFGSTIKRLRKERSLTQDQLANLLNVTPQAVSRWETNAAMPDISLLVPLANVFNVSTDTLLEVNVQKNEEHIRDFCENYCKYEDPYGKTVAEKVRIYREEVRKYPQSAELKEILITFLSIICERQQPWTDLSLYRELATLTEDVIAAGGGQQGLETHQHRLVNYSKVLSNQERASQMVGNALEMSACKEVLLPLSLSGRAQIEARKDLLFKCADTIIKTVYDMYGDNAEDLTNDEWQALKKAENIVAALYGQEFSDYFVLVKLVYKGVRGSLKSGRNDEALQRLQQIVNKLEFRNSNKAVNSPLVEATQFDSLCSHLALQYATRLDTMAIIEYVLKDFLFDDESSLWRNNPKFEGIRSKLAKLMDTDDQQSKIDWWAYLEAAFKVRESVPLD